MAIHEAPTESAAQLELDALRKRLNNELEAVAKLRKEYEAECRRLDQRDDANVFAAKQRLDVATSRIEGKEAEIAEKERLLDQAQGRQADEQRSREAQQDFERASERLAESQAALAELRAEYVAIPERIRLAEWNFSEALRAYNEAKSQV
jgi:hypothetical protein